MTSSRGFHEVQANVWRRSSPCLNVPSAVRNPSGIEYSPTKPINSFRREVDVDEAAATKLPRFTEPRSITPDMARQFAAKGRIGIGVDVDDLVDRVFKHVPPGGD